VGDNHLRGAPRETASNTFRSLATPTTPLQLQLPGLARKRLLLPRVSLQLGLIMAGNPSFACYHTCLASAK